MNAGSQQFDLKGRRVTVMGLGRFGGGVGAVRYLVERGAVVTITDLLSENDLVESLQQLDGCRFHAAHLGGHRDDDFSGADLVVVSPAVSPVNRYLDLARQARVPLTSEMNLFWQQNRGKTIGVTGSNGKSTTTSLLHTMLLAADMKCHLGGNIGRSLLPMVDDIGRDDWVVLELSSFQLEELDRIEASPNVAVVTNFSPNHLDRHGSLEAYRRAKQTILRWQRSDDVAVLNRDDSDVAAWTTDGRQRWFGIADDGGGGTFLAADSIRYRDKGHVLALGLPDTSRLPGVHNQRNILAAACAALSIGVPTAAVARGIASFEALPHRLQKVAEAVGRTFYDDSKATTPDSLIAALQAFSQPIVLLAGGYDKQVDLTDMAAAIARHAKAVALIGQTADTLAKRLAERRENQCIAVQKCDSLEEAFAWVTQQSAAGDVVLLSPGCASYDWFRDFEQRGDRFTRLAGEWCAQHKIQGLQSLGLETTGR